MSKLVGWEEEMRSNSGNSGNQGFTKDGKPRPTYVKIDDGQTKSFRLIGNPIKFYRYFEKNGGKWRRVVVAEEDVENNPIKLKYGKKPDLRYAINVIDRTDGKFKIWEFTYSTYKYFTTWADAAKKNPGGPGAPDFVVQRTKTANGRTSYVLKSGEERQFTAEEAKYIKEVKIFNLVEIYAATPLENMENVLYGTETTGGQKATGSVQQPDTVQQNVQQAPQQPSQKSEQPVTMEDLQF